MDLHVLVADGSRTMRQIVIRALNSLGIESTVEAVDGDHAMVLYDLNEFDLVLTDWHMPKLSGLDLLREIRSRGEKTPVVLLTTEGNEKQIKQAVEAGASEYLLKPLNSLHLAKLQNICTDICKQAFDMSKGQMMNVQYINPFITATNFVFKNMLNCTPSRGEAFLKNTLQPRYEVSGLIGLTGNATGTVVLSFSRDAALGAAGAVMPRTPHVINDTVIDVIGELTNIIVGNAQRELLHFDLELSIPRVLSGKTNVVDFPDNVTPLCVPLDSPWGPLALEVGFVETSFEELTAA